MRANGKPSRSSEVDSFNAGFKNFWAKRGIPQPTGKQAFQAANAEAAADRRIKQKQAKAAKK